MEEREVHYFKRTIKHIQRVQDAALYLITECADDLSLTMNECRVLANNVTHHDSSKFSLVQFQPYVDFTWYMLKKVPGAQLSEDVWEHHYEVENHHPERLGGNERTIPKYEVIEMACDLQAMAEEFGGTSGRGYFEEKWTPKQAPRFGDKWFFVHTIMETCFDCFEERLTHAVTKRVDAAHIDRECDKLDEAYEAHLDVLVDGPISEEDLKDLEEDTDGT